MPRPRGQGQWRAVGGDGHGRGPRATRCCSASPIAAPAFRKPTGRGRWSASCGWKRAARYRARGSGLSLAVRGGAAAWRRIAAGGQCAGPARRAGAAARRCRSRSPSPAAGRNRRSRTPPHAPQTGGSATSLSSPISAATGLCRSPDDSGAAAPRRRYPYRSDRSVARGADRRRAVSGARRRRSGRCQARGMARADWREPEAGRACGRSLPRRPRRAI